MKIVLFTHPSFLAHQSMPRYANMLLHGMRFRGHQVEVWSPKARFLNLSFGNILKKWFSYIDQYLIFPLEVKLKLSNVEKDTLFVFADQALGPWVPLVKNRKHVVHCHDFLALKSAQGQVEENPTSFTGKLYQNYIRSGFSNGKNFISISEKTQKDLHNFHLGKIESSVVCYNGLNRFFNVLPPKESRSLLQDKLNILLFMGYILHIGGNQYYKNRKGVVEIYDSWRDKFNKKIPLLLIGSEPSDELSIVYQKSKFKEDIYFITNLSDEYINLLYSGAICLLFPSLDEGFGWPIIEAMASGCPVLTTNKAPMTEVGGKAAFYIDRRPSEEIYCKKWAQNSASKLNKIVELNSFEFQSTINLGIKNTERFSNDKVINKIENFYKAILNNSN
ncbi:Glycosyltransferase involved in cell wall bisynthesis [Flavobacterium micromati]|uniref:Glycosyltransferase involved in cell wall bisynthesis n=1 Tax=Flavobacterium micromati TaxID=229205 RepID=A0A1M5JL33_9FLAO|nr:glycosyltransferase [Flavobacterium micromati]SHG41241.1 Glycosyltransferase involved in cell wall bisynthesis [Flavobacterium micromati]